MTSAGRVVWDAVAPDMIDKHVLTSWDAPLFAELCEAVIIVQKLRVQALEEASGHINVPAGASSPLNHWRRSLVTLYGLAGRFGMTPADRARMIGPDRLDHHGSDDLLSPGWSG